MVNALRPATSADANERFNIDLVNQKGGKTTCCACSTRVGCFIRSLCSSSFCWTFLMSFAAGARAQVAPTSHTAAISSTSIPKTQQKPAVCTTTVDTPTHYEQHIT
jgi:hypothetical protein